VWTRLTDERLGGDVGTRGQRPTLRRPTPSPGGEHARRGAPRSAPAGGLSTDEADALLRREGPNGSRAKRDGVCGCSVPAHPLLRGPAVGGGRPRVGRRDASSGGHRRRRGGERCLQLREERPNARPRPSHSSCRRPDVIRWARGRRSCGRPRARDVICYARAPDLADGRLIRADASDGRESTLTVSPSPSLRPRAVDRAVADPTERARSCCGTYVSRGRSAVVIATADTRGCRSPLDRRSRPAQTAPTRPAPRPSA